MRDFGKIQLEGNHNMSRLSDLFGNGKKTNKSIKQLEDERDIKTLLNLLGGNDGDVSLAAEALGRLKENKAVEPLIKLLNKPSISNRISSIKALGNIKDLRAVDPLIAVLESNDAHENTKIEAAKALGILGDSRSVPILIKHLQNRNTFLRINTIEALQMIGDRRCH